MSFCTRCASDACSEWCRKEGNRQPPLWQLWADIAEQFNRDHTAVVISTTLTPNPTEVRYER